MARDQATARSLAARPAVTLPAAARRSPAPRSVHMCRQVHAVTSLNTPGSRRPDIRPLFGRQPPSGPGSQIPGRRRGRMTSRAPPVPESPSDCTGPPEPESGSLPIRSDDAGLTASDSLPGLFVSGDGHHRPASAASCGQTRRAGAPDHTASVAVRSPEGTIRPCRASVREGCSHASSRDSKAACSAASQMPVPPADGCSAA